MLHLVSNVPTQRFARLFALALASWLALSSAACGPAQTERERVLIMVVDGLRPDYVTPQIMPRLDALAREGVRGLAHHAVFPTVTRVNGPTIFTGTTPGRHGVMGNSVYFPDVEPSRVLSTSDWNDLSLVERTTNGQLLTVPSLGEMLEERGLTFFASSSGSSGSGMLMNPKGAGGGLVHYEFTIPDTLGPVVQQLLGPVPEIPEGSSGVPLAARAVDALLQIGVDRIDADVLAIWLTEPDGTAHSTGVGSPQTLAALAGVDREIGRLLDGLAERGLLERTNILVTSDHGFSQHTGETSLNALLVRAGLKESQRSTDVVVAGDAVHVMEGGEARIRQIVSLLQSTEWIGPVFTRGASPADELGVQPGTVSFSAIGWDHARSGDILTSANWSDAENEFGYRGEVMTTGTAGHGSSSPWDVRATFIAWGPDIKRGVETTVPTGNVDLVPTTFALLGQNVPSGLDGRVLSEVLATGPELGAVQVQADSILTSVELEEGTYELAVYRSRVGSNVYFDRSVVNRRP